MKSLFRRFHIVMSLFLIIIFSGCSLLYELQPHRLQRLNQGEGMSSEAYYSVSENAFKEIEPKEIESDNTNQTEIELTK